MMPIEFHGLKVYLHPSGAAYIPESKTLLIADLHLGKINHFRSEGIALPVTKNFADFQKIEALLQNFDCKSVIFLGDLFHSVLNDAYHHFSDFIRKYPTIKWHLVLGNHDIIHPELLRLTGLQIYQQSFTLNDVLLVHEPMQAELPHICGHIHPVVRIKGKGRQKIRLRCFVKEPKRLILPAFGYFTGGFEIKPRDEIIIYPIARERLYSL